MDKKILAKANEEIEHDKQIKVEHKLKVAEAKQERDRLLMAAKKKKELAF